MTPEEEAELRKMYFSDKNIRILLDHIDALRKEIKRLDHERFQDIRKRQHQYNKRY